MSAPQVLTGEALAAAVNETTTWAVVIPPRGHAARPVMSRNPRGHSTWAEPTLVLLLDAAFVRSYIENRP